MRALLQRISHASVKVGGHSIGRSGPGLLILICAMQDDTETQAEKLATKIAKLRIFTDDDGKMNLSLLNTGGSALVISQFTLAADTSSGNRPGYSTAARPDGAKHLTEHFTTCLRVQGLAVETGEFGANMQVELLNDGPVTIWLDTENP